MLIYQSVHCHQEGPWEKPGKVPSRVSLSEVKINKKDSRPTGIAQLAVKASQAQPQFVTVPGVLFILSPNIMCLPLVFPQHVWLSQLTAQVGRSGKKPQHTVRCFRCFSLYGVQTKGVQLCSVRWTNICILVGKNPSSCVVSCACFG